MKIENTERRNGCTNESTCVLAPLTERGSIAKMRDSNSVVDIFILVPVMVNIFERKRIVVKNGTRNLIVTNHRIAKTKRRKSLNEKTSRRIGQIVK